jgi:probable rRNA maturation factor
MADGGPSRKTAARSSGLRLEADVVRRGAAWRHAGVTDALLERAARAAFTASPPTRQGTYAVTILLTDDEEMQALNCTWRGKDAPTNVLSFPANDAVSEAGLVGDVVLAYETTRKEARDQSLALADHVSHLVVHGVLHLLGFDHEQDEEAEQMEDLERTALASLGIADPYPEREARAAEVSP